MPDPALSPFAVRARTFPSGEDGAFGRILAAGVAFAPLAARTISAGAIGKAGAVQLRLDRLTFRAGRYRVGRSAIGERVLAVESGCAVLVEPAGAGAVDSAA